MPDLLLELFSEEIPARMQRRAADDLKKLVTDALVARGLVYESASAFSTPRRLTLVVGGLPVKGQDIREEKKGPRVGAPDQAVQGFLKSAGLTSLDQATVISDPKKGDFYVAFLEKPGQATAEAIAEIVPAVIRSFPWPKSMRWGAASTSSSSLRWVRPLQSILCTFGPETEEPEVIRFEVDGIVSGDVTFGHRFHAPQQIRVRRFEDYVAKLEAAKVILDPERRKQIILNEARTLAFAQGLELIEDEALADEVSGLVEWPVPLMGRFDPAFLAIPGEVIRATIRANQKCFVLRAPSLLPSREKVSPQATDEGALDPSPGSAGAEPPSPARGEGVLSNRFILTANLVASDGGGAIIAGNERVVKARLSDALHFWNTDQRDVPDLSALKDSAATLGLDLTKPLDQRMARLDHLQVVFHEKLGTQGERVQRIVALARELARATGADPEKCARAALLAKADLQSEVVGEFPEVQGLMGRRYAELQGEDASVCAAIEEHYKPLGPSDRVPSDPVSVTVALADKLDTLVGFWAIDEKPTGSKDPYALRRAALGVIRLLVENGVRVNLPKFFSLALNRIGRGARTIPLGVSPAKAAIQWEDDFADNLLSFFHDRLKGMLKDQGARHDLVDAVLAGAGSPLLPLREKVPSGSEADEGADPSPGASRHPLPQGERGSSDDLLMVVRRVEALTAFLATEDGANLLAGYRRAANILKAEEKKDGRAFDGAVEAARLAEPEETALATVLATTVPAVADAVGREDFAGAMTALAALRQPVDAFFERVTVNADDPALRVNRLNLLASLRAATLTVADFARIGG